MISDHSVKEQTPVYRIHEVLVYFYSRRMSRKGSYSYRKIPAKILKFLNFRSSWFSGYKDLSWIELASFTQEASSQLQKILNTIKSNGEGCAYFLEVSMVVTQGDSANGIKLPICSFFSRDMKRLIFYRGLLIKDQSWLKISFEGIRENGGT